MYLVSSYNKESLPNRDFLKLSKSSIHRHVHLLVPLLKLNKANGKL